MQAEKHSVSIRLVIITVAIQHLQRKPESLVTFTCTKVLTAFVQLPSMPFVPWLQGPTFGIVLHTSLVEDALPAEKPGRVMA